MSGVIRYDDEYINLARSLVQALESNEHAEASEIIGKLSDNKESVIFQEIGKLTRELHDTLQSFEADINLSGLTENVMQDAKKRLNYVIEKTDEATNQTLNIVESFIPVCEKMGKDADGLVADWSRFMAKDMSADEFRLLAKKITSYLAESNSSYTDIKSGINEIILAQGFQDITGQIIRKVISLVQDVEDNLVRVIKVTGSNNEKEKSYIDDLDGPQVPGMESETAVTSQDEVDDLLSSLGF